MNTRTDSLTQASAPTAIHDTSYAGWSAIMVGAAVAAGATSVFATFGTALGLSSLSPYTGKGSALAGLIAVGHWMIWTTVSSVRVGGYVAGRMRCRVDLALADEVGVRDGIHGLAGWGVAILLGVWRLGSVTSAAVTASTDTAAAAVAAARAQQHRPQPTRPHN